MPTAMQSTCVLLIQRLKLVLLFLELCHFTNVQLICVVSESCYVRYVAENEITRYSICI